MKAEAMKDDGGSGLPASVAAPWGLHTPAAKGPKPGLSLARIVDAAIAIADADGLGAVSMSKVAAELDATAMALYRYVANKDELLALMVDVGVGMPPAPPLPEADWRAGLSEWAWAELAGFRRHPWALRVPITGLPALPNQVTWMDYGLRCLTGVSISEEDKLSVILLISNLVRVYALLEGDLSTAWQSAGRPPDEVVAAFTRTMALISNPDRFPALSIALASGALDTADPVDKEFTFGLERVLDGVDMLISRSGPTPA